MINFLYRLARLAGDAEAASRGPSAFAHRAVRQQAHRGLARLLRKAL